MMIVSLLHLVMLIDFVFPNTNSQVMEYRAVGCLCDILLES